MLTDTRNGKKYIGQHNGSEQSYWSGGLIPNRIAKKHGKSIFERVILEENIPKEKLNEREKFYIKKHRTLEDGYNLTKGGDGGDTLTNNPNKKEIIEKIKLANKDRVFTDEHKANLKKNHMAKNPNNRKKLSDALKGKPKSDEHKKKISNIISEYNKKIGRWVGEDNPLNNEDIKKRICELNKQRGEKQREENIKNFIQNLKSGKINKDNIKTYKNKLWRWRRDIGDEKFKGLIPAKILNEFNDLCKIIKKQNLKLRYKDKKPLRHSGETKKLLSKIKKDDFIDFCNKIHETMVTKNKIYLIDAFPYNEYKKIRKKIKKSKFVTDIPEEIKIKLLSIKPKPKKIIKPTNPNKFYGNKKKTIVIDEAVYHSASEAAKKLDIDRGTIRYRLKSKNYNNYIYM